MAIDVSEDCAICKCATCALRADYYEGSGCLHCFNCEVVVTCDSHTPRRVEVQKCQS